MNCHDLFSAGCFYFQNEERPFRGFNIRGFMGRRLSYSNYRFEMERHSLIHLKFKRKNPSIVGRISSKSQSFLARGQDGASHFKPFPPRPFRHHGNLSLRSMSPFFNSVARRRLKASMSPSWRDGLAVVRHGESYHNA